MNDDLYTESLAATSPGNQKTGRRVLIMTSVSAERDAIWRGCKGDSRFTVLAGGVGPMAAAASTARALATAPFDLVICAGIAGGFADRAEIGSLVVADEIIAADLGAETPSGFCSLDELGFGTTRIQADSSLVASVSQAFAAVGLSVNIGPVLTLSTVTGTAETASELVRRVPKATAEAMEGFGVATAARECGIPIMEIRAISNLVGPRDRDAWRIGDALHALEEASSVLLEVL